MELEPVEGQNDQWWLPEFLNEASGIAVMADQSILLHDDELAVIYHVSLVDHSIESFGWLGSPEFEQDFEGIALNGETLYLATSDGLIYQAAVDLEGRSQTLDFAVFDTGLESICELEGLHFLSGKLLLPCKVPIEEVYKNKLVVFEFDVETHRIREHFSIPSEEFGSSGRAASDLDRGFQQSLFYRFHELLLQLDWIKSDDKYFFITEGATLPA